MTVSADDCDAVLVTADAEIASLTVLGGDSTFQALIRGGVERLSVVGGGGQERVTVAAGAEVGTLRFDGGGGDDVLTVAGSVGGNLRVPRRNGRGHAATGPTARRSAVGWPRRWAVTATTPTPTRTPCGSPGPRRSAATWWS